MKQSAIDSKVLDTLRNLRDRIPVLNEGFGDWAIRVFDRTKYERGNYLSANRCGFYKILMITKGAGVFTMGLNTYYINEPTIIFIHPDDIVSWKNLSDESGGYYVLFKKSFVNNHPRLKGAIEKFALFSEKGKSVIHLNDRELPVLKRLFASMEKEQLTPSIHNDFLLQAYLQLLIVESMKISNFPVPGNASDEYRLIYHFFKLLEKETANINYSSPIRIKTAGEFANDLETHPNQLNAVLKKYTGQNVSTHIRNRLLEEAKVLMLQTDWNLHDISYCIGFSGQPNFNLFFKQKTGFTPTEFRKSYHG